MGGSAASHNNFWQLFVRPSGSTRWRLVTPPGVPDNGGLVVADAGGQSLITGFRPSQYLTYTPLTATTDGGQAWSPAGPLDAALADVPDALAAAPGSGHLLALTASGAAKLAAPGYTSWNTLASQQTLASTPAGRRCGLDSLTAAAFTPSGAPLLAGTCSRPGTAGIFADLNGTWQAAGPAMPATLARQNITVPRLTRTADRLVAMLAAGTGPATTLIAAWSADDGSHWTLSPPLRLNRAALASASFGPGGTAAILTGGHGEMIASAGHQWQLLPALPPGTATLGPRTRRHDRRPGSPPHHADHLAAPARRHRVDEGTGHQRTHPVRVIRLSKTHRARLTAILAASRPTMRPQAARQERQEYG
jgi:hypothetical protein